MRAITHAMFPDSVQWIERERERARVGERKRQKQREREREREKERKLGANRRICRSVLR